MDSVAENGHPSSERIPLGMAVITYVMGLSKKFQQFGNQVLCSKLNIPFIGH
jgi:hypothetical protein